MEGDDIILQEVIVCGISIHSLRMEGDNLSVLKLCYRILFQSTPSVWRETVRPQKQNNKPQEFQSTPSVWRETRSRPLA